MKKLTGLNCSIYRSIAFIGVVVAVSPGVVQAAFGFGPPEALNTTALVDQGTDEYPQLVTDHRGTWVAVWVSSDSLGGTIGSDIDLLFSRSVDDGRTWSPPAVLNSNAAHDEADDSWFTRPALATDRNGNWIAAWWSIPPDSDEASDVSMWMARSTDHAVSWEAPKYLDFQTSPRLYGDVVPQIAAGKDGVWILTWIRVRFPPFDTGSHAMAARSTDLGETWTEPVFLFPEEAGEAQGAGPGVSPFALAPESEVPASGIGSIVSDRRGKWIAIGMKSPPAIHVSIQSTDNGLTWSPPEQLIKVTYCCGGLPAQELATDEKGTWIAAVDGAVLRTSDGSSGWENIPIAPQSYPNWQRIGTNGKGDWAVIGLGSNPLWTEENLLRGFTITISRSCDNGKTWTDGFPLNIMAAAAPGIDLPYLEDKDPMIASNFASGRWIVAWSSIGTAGGLENRDSDIVFSASGNLKTPAGDARMVTHTIPLSAGSYEEIRYEVAMLNTGETAWSYERFFGLAVTEDPCGLDTQPYRRLTIEPGVEVPPGESYVFRGTMFIPAGRLDCELRFRMLQEWTEFFGEEVVVTVKVSDRNSVSDWYEYK